MTGPTTGERRGRNDQVPRRVLGDKDVATHTVRPQHHHRHRYGRPVERHAMTATPHLPHLPRLTSRPRRRLLAVLAVVVAVLALSIPSGPQGPSRRPRPPPPRQGRQPGRRAAVRSTGQRGGRAGRRAAGRRHRRAPRHRPPTRARVGTGVGGLGRGHRAEDRALRVARDQGHRPHGVSSPGPRHRHRRRRSGDVRERRHLGRPDGRPDGTGRASTRGSSRARPCRTSAWTRRAWCSASRPRRSTTC